MNLSELDIQMLQDLADKGVREDALVPMPPEVLYGIIEDLRDYVTVLDSLVDTENAYNEGVDQFNTWVAEHPHADKLLMHAAKTFGKLFPRSN